jgi:D-glycero-alpha-D-manno-heptose-7-phosphate kinase
MIISKTPCRISFAGGGSDIASYYREHGGTVVSVTIDKYIYVALNEKFDHRIRVSYSRTEEADTVDEVQHPIVRSCLKLLQQEQGGIEIVSVADIPSRGSGLGSSSSFTVGLLNGLFAYQGRQASQEELARLSCDVEIDLCGQPIGKQDQYAAAFGDLRMYRFQPDGTVVVEPLICKRQTMDTLQSNLMMFYTGITRNAGDILEQQTQVLARDREAQQKMHRMVEHAEMVRRALESGDTDCIGEILHESWVLKRTLSGGISNEEIDGWYQRARRAGALGGKILGAGGGGFLLMYVPQDRQPMVVDALRELRRIPFRFEREGSKIVYYQPANLDEDESAAERNACLRYL